MFLSRLNEISGGCEKIVSVSESFWGNWKVIRMIDSTAWLWGEMWEWMECDQHFPSEPFVVLNVDQFVGHGGGPLERQKQDSHVYRKTSTLPLIFQKNQSRHYINDEVWETVKKVIPMWKVNFFVRSSFHGDGIGLICIYAVQWKARTNLFSYLLVEAINLQRNTLAPKMDAQQLDKV